MSLDTFVVLANQYSTEADALADYDAVRTLYSDLAVIDTYDAAVLTRKADGEVEIVKRVEEPTRHGAVAGLVLGLAVGAVVALFPAAGVPLAASMFGGGALGTIVGAVAGHVARGMKRSDLKHLGELLNSGTSGLVVVAASDLETKIEAVITKAKKRAKAQLQADVDAMKKEIESLSAQEVEEVVASK